MGSRTDEALRGLTGSFRERLSRGEPLDDLLPEGFAAVREAAARTLGQRHFDVQVMGGAVLHLGKIVEMRTGEGKTLTATLPAYLNALTGAGVHVMTANDYLASRDVGWMGPLYRFLGLVCGFLEPAEHPVPAARRADYLADVTYGAWEQFGYDYLRDNLAREPEECVQRGHNFVIVDEADLILIDEMRTPLQMSAPADQAQSRRVEFAALAASFERGVHYDADEGWQTVSLTEEGAREAEEQLGTGDLFDAENLPMVHDLQIALQAREFYRKDHDYLITDGEAVIIDRTSGRVQPGRRFGDGIHEAIEAKEGLAVRAEQRAVAMVPVWAYLGQYRRLAGMTGTATPEADAYRRIYRRDVVQIPTNKPMVRVDHPDACYRTRKSKLTALADETATRHATGQPVLIGTVSVEESEAISRLFTDRGISHHVLTARNHEQEAQLIADAGGLGAVTIVARMAGRGVHIILGGAEGASHDEVADRGGLCVLGSERPDGRRLEMHLRGRAGRQGDPGEAKFFLSFEDDLVKNYLGTKTTSLLNLYNPEGREFARLSKSLDNAQAKAAAYKATSLAQVLDYDQVLADQQHLTYTERALAVGRIDLRDRIRNLVDEVIRAQVAAAARERLSANQLWQALRELYPISIPAQTIAADGRKMSRVAAQLIADQVAADARLAYDRREVELGEQSLRDLERRVVLALLDRGWREHLNAMPDLLNGIAMRSPGGTASLHEYRREAALLFTRMRDAVKREIVGTLFYIDIEATRAAPTKSKK